MVITVAGTPGKNGSTGDGGSALAATLSGPGGIAADPESGALIVTEVDSGRARLILPDGTILRDTSLPAGSGKPLDVAVTAGGNLYALADKHFVGKPFGETLKEVAGKSGTSGSTGDNAKASAARLNTPAGIAADPKKAGRFWIADSLNNRVRLVDGEKISTAAGNGTAGFSGDGGPATSARLNNCSAVAVDPWGNLYIADTGRLAYLSMHVVWPAVGRPPGSVHVGCSRQHCCSGRKAPALLAPALA